MRVERHWLRSMSVATLALLLMTGVAYARHPTVRWDIVKRDFSTDPPAADPGGIASARANDGSKITVTSTGTFRDKPGNPHADGGGTWTTFAPDGSVTGSGTYEVTGVVQFQAAPGSPGPEIDRIGDPAERSAGFLILTIEYSDGEEGTLVVSCRLQGVPASPASVFEGITASKGFVDYWNREAPVPGIDGNRTLFHISP